MAIITQARMQQLRGKYNQLNKEALLPGEFAICDDHNPIVRTNTGYKELLTADNAEYFENKVTEINNAILSTNEAVDKANKAVADTLQATNDNTQRVDNAIQQIATKVGIDDTQSSTLTTYSSDKIDKLFDGVSGKLPYKIVTSLPETGDENTLYFVPSTSPESNNVYDEYMYIDGMWEYIGSKAINIEDISESRVDTIEEVKERTPISPKDKMKLIVGKIVKTFADIKNIAFSGSIADITDFDTVLSTSLLSTESGKRALDEAVGKVLNDKIEAILTKQGSTDISNIGNGTVTGALSTLNSNIGKTLYFKSDESVNIPTSTFITSKESLLLEEGTWFIQVKSNFSSNPNGLRTVYVLNDNTYDNGLSFNEIALSGSTTDVNGVGIFFNTKETSQVQLRFVQTSNTSLTLNSYSMIAVKIK